MSTENAAISTISGEVIATSVSLDEYMEKYAADFCEWVGGTVIKMSPATLRHVLLSSYLLVLFQTYFAFRPIGKLVAAPFVMKLAESGRSREPDLQIILNTNPGELTATAMNGPADICIEIVSPESDERDYGEKFVEYEKAGVREYWIIDSLRDMTTFYRQNDVRRYIRQAEDQDGNYLTPLLPGFALPVSTLWADPLPTPPEIVQAVEALLQS